MGWCVEQVAAQAVVDPAAEQRRWQERSQAQRQQLERVPEVRWPTEPLHNARLPTGAVPCVPIKRLVLDNTDYPYGSGIAPPNPVLTETFEWLLAATAGPQGDDSPLGQCLGDAGFKTIVQRAQSALLAKGFSTTRVLMQPQDLSTGTLVLIVIPGHISTIRFKSGVAPGVRSTNTIPARPGDILNVRDVEQGLENLKRVPTAEADIQIEPAQDVRAVNQSDLVLVYAQPSMARLSLSVDDSGSKGTGRYQGSATVSLDNPLGLSDLFYLSANHDLGGGEEGPRGTRGHTVHYSLPLGYWALGATYVSSRYFQHAAGPWESYIYSGTSENTELKLSRLVYRDAVRKTTISLAGWQRKSRNYSNDDEIGVQRRVVGGWELGLNHKDVIGDTTLEGSLAFKRGTTDFDAIPAPEERYGEGTAKFGLLLLDLNATVPFTAWGQSFQYKAALRVQDNTTPLTPQDRIAIGGRYSVRGYDGEYVLVGERGWTLRNDWSVALGASGQEAYLGLDAGEVAGPSTEYLLGKSLVGAVLGLRGSFKHLRTSVHYELFVGALCQRPASANSMSPQAHHLVFRRIRGCLKTAAKKACECKAGTAIGTRLASTQKIEVSVGNSTELRGTDVEAPQIAFIQTDPNKAGELILGASISTTQTAHTEKTETAGVYQAMKGNGQCRAHRYLALAAGADLDQAAVRSAVALCGALDGHSWAYQ